MSAEKFIAGLELQELLRDKDSGLPLALGSVSFFEDANRTILKPVFEFTGSPGNPAFTALPNPLPVNGAGMPIDTTGNPVAVYYFPFEADGTIPQLYFVEVRNQGGVLQNTRENWPPGEIAGGGGEVSKNFIPNPQFSIFNTSSKDGKRIVKANPPSNDPTVIAYGGWEASIPNGSTTEFTISFDTFGLSPVPDDAPRRALNVEVTANDASDIQRIIGVRFIPVNVFSSDINKFTFSFWGKSNTASNVVLKFQFQKFYGSAGSPITITNVTTFTLTPSYQQFFIPFVFGDDDGKTLGIGEVGDLTLFLEMPLTVVSHFSVTNFILKEGEIDTPIFPPTPISEVTSESLPNNFLAPNPDGSDLFLPIFVTNRGMEYDRSSIARIDAVMRDPVVGELLCDGSGFQTDSYSSDGIPFSRLQAVIGNRFGTGPNFVTMYHFTAASSNRLILSNNAKGTQGADPVNVTAGIVVRNVHVSVEDEQFFSGITIQNSVEVVAISFPPLAVPGQILFTNQPAAFTLSKLQGNNIVDGVEDPTGNSRIGYRIIVNAFPTPGVPVPPPLAPFIQFGTTRPVAGLPAYMWFTIDGVGVDPSPPPPPGFPGQTTIQIDLYTAVDTPASIAAKIALALNSTVQWDIEFPVVPGTGTYWEFDTFATGLFYVWYTLAGGDDPAPLNRTGIRVDLAPGDTTTLIATKTQTAINNFRFAIPDLQGMFLRGTDPDSRFDSKLQRFNFFQQNLVTNPELGSWQYPQIISHAHTVQGVIAGGGGAAGNEFMQSTETTSFTGTKDVTPWNTSVNFIIKY